MDVKLLISGLKQVEARLELSADQVKAMVYDELPANMQSDEQEREAKDQVVKHMNAVMSHLMNVHDLVVDVLDKGLSRGANASDIHNATYFAAQTIVLLGIREQDLIEYADADADTLRYLKEDLEALLKRLRISLIIWRAQERYEWSDSRLQHLASLGGGMVDRLKRCRQKANELTLKRLSRVIGVEIGGVREIAWRADPNAKMTDYTREVRRTYRALLKQIRLLHGENLRSLLNTVEGMVLAQERIAHVDAFVFEQDDALH